jgi:hypothetical protein
MSKRRWQRGAIQAIGWTFGLFWLSLFFGVTDLSVPLFFHDRPEFYEGYLVETGWGVLFTFFAGLPMCLLGARPEWISAAVVSAASGFAILIGAVASAQPLQLLIVALLLLPAAAVLLLDRGMSARAWRGSDPVGEPSAGDPIAVLGLALVAMPPAALYAADMIRAARTGEPEPIYTYDFDHWPIQAASVLVIPLATVALSFRRRGWRPMAFLVASGTAWFGIISLVYPDHVASWGTEWGWTAVAWAVALASLALRRQRARSDPGLGSTSDRSGQGRLSTSERPYSGSMRKER